MKADSHSRDHSVWDTADAFEHLEGLEPDLDAFGETETHSLVAHRMKDAVAAQVPQEGFHLHCAVARSHAGEDCDWLEDIRETIGIAGQVVHPRTVEEDHHGDLENRVDHYASAVEESLGLDSVVSMVEAGIGVGMAGSVADDMEVDRDEVVVDMDLAGKGAAKNPAEHMAEVVAGTVLQIEVVADTGLPIGVEVDMVLQAVVDCNHS